MTPTQLSCTTREIPQPFPFINQMFLTFCMKFTSSFWFLMVVYKVVFLFSFMCTLDPGWVFWLCGWFQVGFLHGKRNTRSNHQCHTFFSYFEYVEYVEESSSTFTFQCWEGEDTKFCVFCPCGLFSHVASKMIVEITMMK